MRERAVLLFTLLMLLIGTPSLSEEPTSALTVEASPGALSIAHASPNGRVVVTGVGRALDGYVTMVRTSGGTVDADIDGTATYAASWLEDALSAWAVVDEASGSIALLETGGHPSRFRRAARSIEESLTFEGRRLRVLVVRPGTAVWGHSAVDGTGNDVDAQRNGTVTLEASTLESIGDRATTLESVAAGDVVIAIDMDDLSISVADVVDGAPAIEDPKIANNIDTQE